MLKTIDLVPTCSPVRKWDLERVSNLIMFQAYVVHTVGLATCGFFKFKFIKIK